MTKVTFEVLGPVVVRHPDGRQAELTGKAKAVLATLLLHANTPVTRQRLIEALWDDPPASAVPNVQTYISQIRRALPPAARLHTLDSGYLLEVAREDVDLLVFEDQVRLAGSEADPERAARRLDRALRLWRGAPAEDTSLTGTMTARFAELEERLAGARSDWADRLLQLGMEAEAVSGLRRFTREHSLRAARLADNAARLDELAIGGQDVRAGFAMSYDALPDMARRAFRLLGLAGLDSTADWSLAALMGGKQRQAEAAAETLALAGLISAEEVDLCGQPRYRMHDLLQDFAHERAQAEESPADRRAALARLVEECLRRVRGGLRDYPPPARPPLREYSSDQRESSGTWLLAERGTLEAAVALAEPAQAVELAQRLSPFLAAHGFRQEVSDLLEGVALRAPDTRSAMLTRLVLADIELEYHRCRAPAADPAHLLAYFEQSGDGHACAYALLALATRDLMEGWPGEALARAERAIARFEALNDTYGLLNALSTAGGANLDLGRHEAVATVCRRALGLATEPRYGDHAVRFRRMLGIASFNSGEVEAAIEHYKQSAACERPLHGSRPALPDPMTPKATRTSS